MRVFFEGLDRDGRQVAKITRTYRSFDQRTGGRQNYYLEISGELKGSFESPEAAQYAAELLLRK